MDSATVVYNGTLNGERVIITLADVMANDTIAERVIGSGVKRVIDTAAQGHEGDEDKAAARLARARDIINGRVWQSGGGNRLSEADRARRDILASFAAQYLSLTHSKAEELVRTDSDKAVTETARAIIKAQDGKAPARDRLTAGIEKFQQLVERKVSERLETVQSVDI